MLSSGPDPFSSFVPFAPGSSSTITLTVYARTARSPTPAYAT
jgi:hypothetical protein